MNLKEYQLLAMRTAGERLDALAYGGLGLAGEAGEVIELIKKHVGHGHDLNSIDLAKELGDVLWYVTYIAHTHGLSLETIARMNIIKLKARYPEGFSQEASQNRPEE